jgi:hypothetical protein
MAIALAALIAGSVHAGQFDKSLVPANAKWIVFVDVAKLTETDTGQYLLAQIDNQEGGNRLAALQTLLNLNLRKDLRTLTIYGTNNIPEQSATLFDGAFDQNKLVAALQANDTYLKFDHGNHAIHSWMQKKPPAAAPERPGGASDTPPGKRVFGAFHGRRVVVSQNLATIKGALDVLDAKRPSLDSSRLLDSMQSPSPSSFLTAASELSPADMSRQQGVFRQTRHVNLDLGESQGNLDGTLVLTSDNVQAASHVYLLVQGLVAAAILQQQQKPEMARFAQAMKVVLQGEKVRITVNYPFQQALNSLQAWRTQLQSASLPIPQSPRPK